MSTAKSVIQIDVDDAKFKAFQRTFDLYQNALKTQPKQWNAANEAAVQHSAAIDGLLIKLEKHQKQVNKEIAESNQKLKDTVKQSAEIASNFASAALSMAKWVTLGALGGGFGLGALAANASSNRREARGLGISTGDLRAAKTDLGRYIDPESTLNAIADIKSNPKLNYLIGQLGGDINGNPADIMPQLMKSARSLFNKSGQNMLTAQSYGLTEFFTPEALRSMGNTGEEEFNESLKNNERDRIKFNVSDKDNKLMEDFWIALKGAGETMEIAFIKVLNPLLPSLIGLTESATKAIASFLSSKEVKESIENLAKYIGSPESKKDMKDFFDGLSSMGQYMLKIGGGIDTVKDVVNATGKGLGDFMGFLSVGHWDQYAHPGQNVDPNDQSAKLAKEAEYRKNAQNKIAWDAFNHPETASLFASLEKSRGLPPGLLAQIRQVESGGNDNAIGPMTKYGTAKGGFGFLDSTSAEYGVKNPFSVQEEGTAAAAKIKHLMDKYKNNIADALAAYNWGEGNLDKFIKGEKGYTQLPKETNDYLHKFNIYVTSSAGSDLNMIAAALP